MTVRAVLKPSEKIELDGLAVAQHLVLADEPAGDRPSPHRGRVDAGPVVHDRDHDLARLLRGREQEGAHGRLAPRGALRGRLDPVVDRVADQVDERLADLVDHRLVDPGLLPLQDQLHLLALLVGEVADEAREPLEDVPDGQHPDVHDRFLQLGGHARDLVHGVEQVLGRVGDDRGQGPAGLEELGAVDDELSDEVQEVIQLAEVDAHHAGPHGGERGGRGDGRGGRRGREGRGRGGA